MIEVVASLALLSMLLVGILKSFSANQRQLTMAGQQQIANMAMDELLAVWFDSNDPFPVNASGVCGNENQFFWQSTFLGNRQVSDDIVARVIQVQITSATVSGQVLSQVELVDRVPQPATGGSE